MFIEKINKFKLDNKEFDNLKDVKGYVEDVIGKEVLDKINRNIDIKHKDLLMLFNIITSKDIRYFLIKYLDIKIEVEDDEDEDDTMTINILDYKP